MQLLPAIVQYKIQQSMVKQSMPREGDSHLLLCNYPPSHRSQVGGQSELLSPSLDRTHPQTIRTTHEHHTHTMICDMHGYIHSNMTAISSRYNTIYIYDTVPPYIPSSSPCGIHHHHHVAYIIIITMQHTSSSCSIQQGRGVSQSVSHTFGTLRPTRAAVCRILSRGSSFSPESNPRRCFSSLSEEIMWLYCTTMELRCFFLSSSLSNLSRWTQ